MDKKFDLQDRLIGYAGRVIRFSERLPKSISSRHMHSQLVRSATSSALNYGEAQAAESRKDFLYKMQICLKELRETNINLRILHDAGIAEESIEFQELVTETDELIAIFFSSVKTAKVKLA